jgi:hypothetical protein
MNQADLEFLETILANLKQILRSNVNGIPFETKLNLYDQVQRPLNNMLSGYSKHVKYDDGQLS